MDPIDEETHHRITDALTPSSVDARDVSARSARVRCTWPVRFHPTHKSG